MPTRKEVYEAIDSERDYQDAGRGNANRHANSPDRLLPGEIILCIQKCANDATNAWYTPTGGKDCLPFLRKIAGLAVQAMENYGAPKRG